MKGLLFCKEMREAIRAGRKSQTRRLTNPQPVGRDRIISYMGGFQIGCMRDSENAWRDIKPRYRQGETVYVKEPWGIHPTIPGPIYYKDIGSSVIDKWKSPLFMPQWAARDFLKIESVRAERLQEITEEDAKAEGVQYPAGECLAGYAILWDSINPDHPWASNPWIFRYQFSKVTP